MNNKLKPLEQWYCDSCGKLIGNKEDGYLEWLHTSGEMGDQHAYVITHNKRACLYDQRTLFKEHNLSSSGTHIESFLGADGLLNLLADIEDNMVRDNSEIIEIIKRLHTPYYEEARTYVSEAEIDNEFDGMAPVVRSFQSTNIRLIERYSK